MIKINNAFEKVGCAFREFNAWIDEGRREFGNNDLVKKSHDSAALMFQSFITLEGNEKEQEAVHTCSQDDIDAFFNDPATIHNQWSFSLMLGGKEEEK